jgi:hypothetical protein
MLLLLTATHMHLCYFQLQSMHCLQQPSTGVCMFAV